MSHAVILAATRTPIGSFQGRLAAVPAPRLGAVAIQGALAATGLAPAHVSDVLMGNVLQAGLGQAPARQAALQANLPASTRCVTVHKVCGSGLQAVMQGVHALAAGDASLVVAGGMENMSAAPYLLPKAREGFRLGHQRVLDSMVHDGLWDPYADLHMGGCAEECVRRFAISREEQDAYAAESFRRANAAQQAGRFAGEITPVVVSDGRAERRVEQDEGPGRVNYERLRTLKPVFEPGGTITAANASTLNDGAAALVLAREETATALGVRPLARIVAFGAHAQDPVWFTTAPISAAGNALRRAGWTTRDVDLWEVNEAFAVVPLVFQRETGVPADRLNVRGGAIALGHPIGASGARILVTLLAALRERGGRRGLAVICIGGGEALAICVERVSEA
ncbi:thiolase family protein [Opitutus sp. ER46]|uniref:thiolase family protein n=1 Tax=Opitutus sp. ER46 TaxID=2161864 RepID=UPI000D31970C|nr:thiolase family protein [Opitutus sp. ER46]PTX96430.1 acetyl-CoA C-acetyltransferase [Opitutus sp. ER46]